MLLHLTRDVFGTTATLGRLSVEYDGALAYDGHGWSPNPKAGPQSYGYTVEDEDRGLDAADPSTLARKVKAETAIPVGEYVIRRTYSPKYGRDVMQLLDVPGFVGIRVHSGRDETHTAGCLIPGLHRDERRGWVQDSRKAVDWLDARVQECAARGEVVRIRIGRDAGAWAKAQGRAA